MKIEEIIEPGHFPFGAETKVTTDEEDLEYGEFFVKVYFMQPFCISEKQEYAIHLMYFIPKNQKKPSFEIIQLKEEENISVWGRNKKTLGGFDFFDRIEGNDWFKFVKNEERENDIKDGQLIHGVSKILVHPNDFFKLDLTWKLMCLHE